MNTNSDQTIEKKSKKPAEAAGFVKRVEKKVATLVKWALALSFPIWIYGMMLAIEKGEIKPIGAMTILVVAAGILFRIKIIKPLKVRLERRKITE